MKTSKLGIGIVLVLVPLLLLILPLPPNRLEAGLKKQDWVLGMSLAIAAASAAAYLLPNPLFRQRSIWPLILLGTSLLVAANVQWNKSFRKYNANHTYRREVFRTAMAKTLHWPMYGRYDNAIARYDLEKKTYSFATLPYAVIATGIVAAWFWWARRQATNQPWGAGSFAILIAFMIAAICAFAICEDPNRFDPNISGYGEFSKDIHRFKGVRGTLRHYVERMPTLQWYGQHYPPGNLLLMQIEQHHLPIPGLTKGLVILLTALTVVPLCKLARELELPNDAASAAVLLFAASTTVLILCTINTTSLLVFPATMCLWMLVRGIKSGSPLAAILLGAFFFMYLMFSFSASIVGVLMALIAVIAWLRGAVLTRNVVLTGAISLATVGLLIAAAYVTTRFNLIACFLAAVRGHHEQQGNTGFDDPRRYLLRSTGNMIAYLTSTVPLCILAIAAACSKAATAMQRAAFVGVVATIFIAGFSGLFYLETERIWIFLIPALALAAGFEAARRAHLEDPWLVRVMLLLVFIITCSQEYWFMHYR